MQSNKKKQPGVFIIGGGIALAVLLVLVIICGTEVSKTGQAIYMLQEIDVESPEAFQRFLMQATVAAIVVFLVFVMLVHQYRKNEKAILNQEKADKDRLIAALAQI